MAKVAEKQRTSENKKTGDLPGKVTGRTIFNQIIIFFTIGCIFGTYWEEIMYIVAHLWQTGTFEWVSRRGLLYGPFSPVYGIGAVLIYLCFYRPKLDFWSCFFLGALFGGVLEFVLSLLQEWLFGTISWDYSEKFLNIGGRTTIPFMIVWGALVAVFVRFVYPWIDKMYQQVNPRTMNAVCLGLAIFLAFDITISLVATARQSMRRAGDPADNAIEVFLDKYYDDERMLRTYSNARAINKDTR